MKQNEKEVGLLLHRLGVSSKYHGFKFLMRGLTIMLEDEGYRDKTMKYLYESLAKEFSCSSICVERNIRTCIDRSWSKVSYDTINKTFGSTMNYEVDSPSNRDFILNLIDYLKFRK